MIDPLAFMAHKRRLLRSAVLSALCVPLMPVAIPAVAAAAVETADSFRYVFIAPGKGSSMMSASIDDIERATSLRAGKEALLYVRAGGDAYVVRDAETLRRVEAIFKPQEEVGARQGELGRQQGELGKRQAKLGAEQARLGLLQANARPREQGELGHRQGELGRQQGELGRQQGELGRQQGELGKEQARLAREAAVQLRALLADAIQRGAARRVN